MQLITKDISITGKHADIINNFNEIGLYTDMSTADEIVQVCARDVHSMRNISPLNAVEKSISKTRFQSRACVCD